MPQKPVSHIEYFYAVHSAFAYLGALKLKKIVESAGARLIHRPINLGIVVRGAFPDGVVKRTQANRDYYFGREIERWGEYRNVAFAGGIPANHRNDITLANCILIAADEQGENVDHLAYAFMKAHWLHEMDLANEKLLAIEMEKVGVDVVAVLAAAKGEEILKQYEANNAEAIKRNVFGSPTYFVDGDMFFGQDHLELVERALTKPFAKRWSGT